MFEFANAEDYISPAKNCGAYIEKVIENNRIIDMQLLEE